MEEEKAKERCLSSINMTAKLLYTPKIVNVVKASDLNDFISTQYGVSFDVMSDWEMGEGSSATFKINGLLEPWQYSAIGELMMGGHTFFVTQHLLNDLCERGIIEPGEYLVES